MCCIYSRPLTPVRGFETFYQGEGLSVSIWYGKNYERVAPPAGLVLIMGVLYLHIGERMSNLIQSSQICPNCGGKRSYAVYNDNTHCFKCKKHKNLNRDIPIKKDKEDRLIWTGKLPPGIGEGWLSRDA